MRIFTLLSTESDNEFWILFLQIISNVLANQIIMTKTETNRIILLWNCKMIIAKWNSKFDGRSGEYFQSLKNEKNLKTESMKMTVNAVVYYCFVLHIKTKDSNSKSIFFELIVHIQVTTMGSEALNWVSKAHGHFGISDLY